MSAPDLRSDYDAFAAVYNRWMGADFAVRAWPAIDRLLLSRLPSGAHLLDLCCGAGHMASALSRHGFRVTGVDASEQMLKFARQNAPSAEFVCTDARTFVPDTRFDAAVSTFNSFAHFATSADLQLVFRCVRRALLPGAPFLFDLSMEEAYTTKWCGSYALVEDDHACIVRPSYNPDTRIATNRITLFQKDADAWSRSDFSIQQRCHSPREIDTTLKAAYFPYVQTYDAERDLGIAGEAGRLFFLCR